MYKKICCQEVVCFSCVFENHRCCCPEPPTVKRYGLHTYVYNCRHAGRILCCAYFLLQAFDNCIDRDLYLAIAYFQRGVAFFKLQRYILISRLQRKNFFLLSVWREGRTLSPWYLPILVFKPSFATVFTKVFTQFISFVFKIRLALPNWIAFSNRSSADFVWSLISPIKN